MIQKSAHGRLGALPPTRAWWWLLLIVGTALAAASRPVDAAGSTEVRADKQPLIGGTEANMTRDHVRGSGDITRFVLPRAEASLCREACRARPECFAWTYRRPSQFSGDGPSRVFLPEPTAPECALHGGAVPPEAVKSDCCDSGTILRVVSQSDMENDTDRRGKHMTGLSLSQPDPALCRQACSDDPECLAWTYVRAQRAGDRPWCSLMRGPPPVATSNACCISGVVPRLQANVSARGAAGSTQMPTDRKQGLLDGAQWNTSRHRDDGDFTGSGDITAFWMPSSAEASQCQEACRGRPECFAWTYRKLSVDKRLGAMIGPQCTLHGGPVPRKAKEADCCISGEVLRVGPPRSDMENDTDRPGKDFARFRLSQPDPALCRQACSGNAECFAWTYERVPGDMPWCSLKRGPPPVATANACCISGVVPRLQAKDAVPARRLLPVPPGR